MTSDLARATERWFLRRGVPHFIHQYNATEDVLTRTLPFLVLVFLIELVGALNEAWPVWANVLAGLGGLLILLGGWAAANRLRDRRLLVLPERVGGVEIAVFLMVPALLPVVFGGDLGQGALVLVSNLGVLAVAYGATSYGLIPMSRWAVGRLLTQVGSLVGLFARALPLLLLAFMFLFINAEVWAVASGLDGLFLWGTFALFGGLTLLFIVVRLPIELRRLAEFGGWDDVTPHLAESPLSGVAPRRTAPDDTVLRLSRREWSNLGLVALFSQVVQIALVSALIAGFFVAFGVLAVAPDTIGEWTARLNSPEVLATLSVAGRSLVITEELLKVAGFLGSFAGLYFAVYVIQDAGFRAEFLEEIAGEVRESLAVRALYRDAVVDIPA